MTNQIIKTLIRALPKDSPYFAQAAPEQADQASFPALGDCIRIAQLDPALGWNFAKCYADAEVALPPFVVQPAWVRAHRFLLQPDQRDLSVALARALNLPETRQQRDLLRALLICTDASAESIAALCDLDPEVVACFEALFWNVLDRKKNRLFLGRICGQIGPVREVERPQMPAELGLELLRIAYHSGRAEQVLRAAGVDPAQNEKTPLATIYREIWKGLVADASEKLAAGKVSKSKNPSLWMALRIRKAIGNKRPAQKNLEPIGLAESIKLVLDAVQGTNPRPQPAPQPELGDARNEPSL